MNAVETTGVVYAQYQLRPDEPLPISQQSRVRVIALAPETVDISEEAWTNSASASPALDFLKEAAGDVYTAAGGKSFREQAEA